MRVHSSAIVASLLFCACNLVLGTEEGVLTGGAGTGASGGAGANGGSPPAGGNGGVTSDGGGGATTTTGGEGGEGGQPQCTGTGQGTCANPPECQTVECLGGECVPGNESIDVLCSAGHCNGNGTCVECVDNAECNVPAEICDVPTGTCVLAACNDQMKDGQETDTDCGGPDCPPCMNMDDCANGSDCTSGFCLANTCTACGTDNNCPPNKYCDPAVNNGTCRDDLMNGAGCTSNSQCQNNANCVDSVCCDAPCGGTCVSCKGVQTGGTDGTCAPIMAGADPANECAAGPCLTGACSGTGNTCGFAPSGTGCNDGTFCNGADMCNAAGGCTMHSGDPCPHVNCHQACNEATDMCNLNDPFGAPCIDGLYCNGPDTCGPNGNCNIHGLNPCPGTNMGDDCNDSCNEATDTCTAADFANTLCDEDNDGTNGTCSGNLTEPNCIND